MDIVIRWAHSEDLDAVATVARRAYEKMGFEKALPSIRFFCKL